MLRHLLLLASSLLAFTAASHAALVSQYVGLDTLSTLATGTYAGLPNPNQGRLTFLFAHPSDTTPSTNHYHPIGTYRYSGPAATPIVENFGTNYQIPETYTGQPPQPLTMTSGGLFNGRLTLQYNPANEYSDPVFNATRMLQSFPVGTPEAFMYNSSGGRYNGDLTNAITALQLISLSPGLHVGKATQLDIVQNPYDTHLLGFGNSINFEPIFWTAAAAPEGIYSARFRLVDLTNTAQPSGEFVFNLAVVPEPGSATLALLSVGLLLRRRR